MVNKKSYAENNRKRYQLLEKEKTWIMMGLTTASMGLSMLLINSPTYAATKDAENEISSDSGSSQMGHVVTLKSSSTVSSSSSSNSDSTANSSSSSNSDSTANSSSSSNSDSTANSSNSSNSDSTANSSNSSNSDSTANSSNSSNSDSTANSSNSKNIEDSLDTASTVSANNTTMVSAIDDSAKVVSTQSLTAKINSSSTLQATSGTWGTATWTYDADTDTYTISGGVAGTAADKPWTGGNYYETANTIIFTGTLVLPEDCTSLLAFTTDVQGTNYLDTSQVVNMKFMLQGCEASDLDVSNWDTSNVTSMFGLFNSCSKVINLNVSNWNTSNVTNMDSVFNGTSKLANLDVSHWDTFKVTTMNSLFYGTSLTSLDLSNWKTSNVTDMSYMFSTSGSITNLDISNFDTSNVTNMNSMFAYCFGLTSLDLSNFVTSSVTNMETMFRSCWKLTSLDVSNFDTSNVTTMYNMLKNLASLKVFTFGTNFKMLSTIGFNTKPMGNDYSGRWEYIQDIDGNSIKDGASYSYDEMYTATAPGTYVWQKAINLVDSTLIAGPGTTWDSSDNFVSATDADGNTLIVSDLKVTGTVDATTPGSYKVTYSYTDSAGNTKEETATVTVIASKVAITVKDSTLVAGPGTTWDSSDNFVSATDADGNTLTVSDLKVTGTVDATTPGNYKVTYSYTDSAGNMISKVATITVVNSGTPKIPAHDITLNAHDSSIKVGSSWKASDNFDGGTNTLGQTITIDEVTVKGTVNTKNSGNYTITYSYEDPSGKAIKKTITIKVIDNQLARNGSIKKGSVVYGLKHIYLYKKTDFNSKERLTSYAKKSRINRPMFVVTEIVKNANGRVRYLVKDVNKKSKTYGMTGYITANSNFVTQSYYTNIFKKVTVIASHGVNSYSKKTLSGQVKHYKQGQVLNITGLVRYNKTSRFILSNGKYVTANKKLIKLYRQKFAKSVRSKSNLKVYKDVNLTKRVSNKKLIKKGTKVTIKNLDYSNNTTSTKKGTKRYLIKDGYISGNKKFIQVLKLK